MADDIDSHELLIELGANSADLSSILNTAASGYLAAIAGGKATWVVCSRAPIAVMAQQWKHPKLLPAVQGYNITQLSNPLFNGDEIFEFKDGALQLYFRYNTQKDPDEIWNKMAQNNSR